VKAGDPAFTLDGESAVIVGDGLFATPPHDGRSTAAAINSQNEIESLALKKAPSASLGRFTGARTPPASPRNRKDY